MNLTPTDPAVFPPMPLHVAERRAEGVAAVLAPFCERIEVAGSIRRRREQIGDIDLVCLTKPGERARLIERCKIRGEVIKCGEHYAVFSVGLPDGSRYQLDLWFAHKGGGDLFEPDPPNFGILLLARTGSAAHNVFLCQTAIGRGLHFSPNRGIIRRNEVIAAGTEHEIFSALGLGWVPPEKRER
jgi:DNA polymerase (family X)